MSELKQRTTNVERILNKLKNHPDISITIVIGIVIISMAKFTDAIKNFCSFFVQSEKPQNIQQIEKSPGAIQAGRDVNINIEHKSSSFPSPIARFPFDLQVRRVKDRIKYLSQKYLQTDTMSLIEVIEPYGDNVLDTPQLYDWDKVMSELERQGYIKILRGTENNIEFKVLMRK